MKKCKISKIKITFLSLLSIFMFGNFSPVKAEIIPGTNYENVSALVIKEQGSDTYYKFDSNEAKKLFLESNSNFQTRSYGVSLTRRIYSHSYNGSTRRYNASAVINGGSTGVTHTVSRSVGFTDPDTGLGFTLGSSTTFTAPRYTNAKLVMWGTYRAHVYRLQVQYRGTNRWVNAGTVTTYTNVQTHYTTQTWR